MLCILLQLEQPHALYLAADADSEEMKCGKLTMHRSPCVLQLP